MSRSVATWLDFAGLTGTKCFRNAYLVGITAGFSAGSFAFLKTWNGLRAGNWAIGAFAVGTMAAWHTCSHFHNEHVKKMHALADQLNRKQAELNDRSPEPPTTTPPSS
ncbi:uncharacterized protein AMSG_09690 [Thecamonas trahens ATCC 50062]|uniref:Cytochrome c oxidase assembly protein COX20, mitochondrial n=1 Tax=Thecamonas trahens ATCC 50062 TaxID=461836 RepID=A0A0L0DP33_THETB|nr:hypothetical protein AMSG_09690 [Thecamonas trahens ATCC 50062]KNC54030.1 hypothetical protein AMSG_09690 [Thecamonas trahens ATCC 50062]|eukprot:XP_013754043.1 hypothetical protein AMSG_09690 [Thecamonas trahens ATCC 50062]